MYLQLPSVAVSKTYFVVFFSFGLGLFEGAHEKSPNEKRPNEKSPTVGKF